MGQSVSGLRDKFYRRLILEYRKDGTSSFLYRYFWTECATELLARHLPAYAGPVEPEDEPQIIAQLKDALKQQSRPEQNKRSRKKKREVSDFWEELWLRDARVQAGLSSKADYFLWLVEYLAAHDTYYKDTSMWDGRLWLDALLKKGLDWKEGTREPGRRAQKEAASRSDRVYTSQLGKDLNLLAEESRRHRAKIAGRLEGLTERDRSVLTGRLKQMALHIKIKNWLQNSGYYLPTIKETDVDKVLFQKGSREKQDFTMRMFEACCARTDGSFFFQQAAGSRGWRLDGNGFCLLEAGQLAELQKELELVEDSSLYLPLGVDPRSGCVFFLAGKELYRALYEAEEAAAKAAYLQAQKNLRQTSQRACEAAYRQAKQARADYEASPARFCFDYLRLDGEHVDQSPWDVGGSFRLRPKFHKNMGKSYQDMLEDFEWYCINGDDRELDAGSPREAVRELNPEGAARIPEPFRWAFDILEVQEPSPEAAAAFDAAWNRPEERPGSARNGQVARYPDYI